MLDKNHFSRELLKKRNLKATATRMKVLDMIKAYETAMPYAKIQQLLAGADRITLYRTLQVLLEKGLIHKAYTTAEETYYALCGNTCTEKVHRHNHLHFKCTACEAVTCEYVAQELIISLPAYKVDKVSIHASGLCQHCNTEAN